MRRRLAKKWARQIESDLLPSSLRSWLSAPDDEEAREISQGIVEMALDFVLSFRAMALDTRNPWGASVNLESLDYRTPSQLAGTGSVTWSRSFGDDDERAQELEVVFDLASLRKHRVSYVLEGGDPPAD